MNGRFKKARRAAGSRGQTYCRTILEAGCRRGHRGGVPVGAVVTRRAHTSFCNGIALRRDAYGSACIYRGFAFLRLCRRQRAACADNKSDMRNYKACRSGEAEISRRDQRRRCRHRRCRRLRTSIFRLAEFGRHHQSVDALRCVRLADTFVFFYFHRAFHRKAAVGSRTFPRGAACRLLCVCLHAFVDKHRFLFGSRRMVAGAHAFLCLARGKDRSFPFDVGRLRYRICMCARMRRSCAFARARAVRTVRRFSFRRLAHVRTDRFAGGIGAGIARQFRRQHTYRLAAALCRGRTGLCAALQAAGAHRVDFCALYVAGLGSPRAGGLSARHALRA